MSEIKENLNDIIPSDKMDDVINAIDEMQTSTAPFADKASKILNVLSFAEPELDKYAKTAEFIAKPNPAALSQGLLNALENIESQAGNKLNFGQKQIVKVAKNQLKQAGKCQTFNQLNNYAKTQAKKFGFSI
jgi:hypothetical protein